jgi:peptidoglycan/xylan/chitin deacetylase (PgdA/CDA1 family)
MRFLRIHIGTRRPEGDFPLQVSAAAGDVHEQLVFPERLLARATHLLQPDAQLPARDEAAFGVYLARRIFTPAVRKLLLQELVAAREHNNPLRLLLQIDPPELAVLPWEWLTNPGSAPWSPALYADYGLLRVPPTFDPTPHAPVAAARPAGMRVLLAASHAEDATLPALRAALDAVGQAANIQYEILAAPSAPALRQALQRYRPHLLHLIAPVTVDPADPSGQPRLLVAPDEPLSGSWQQLDAAGLAQLLTQQAAPPLVVLNQSGSPPGMLTATAPRLALELTRHGLPAAVAFHATLPPAATTHFAQGFATTLAQGDPVEVAMAAGRRVLKQKQPDAWGMPLLAAATPGWTIRTITAADRTGAAVARVPARPRFRPIPFLPAAAVILLVFLIAYSITREQQSSTIGMSVGQPTAVPTATLLQPAAPPTLSPAPTSSPTLSAYDQARGPVAPPLVRPGPTITPSPLPALVNWATYVVAPDDTLPAIAARMGSDPQAIAHLNKIDPVEPLRVGRGLVIPVYQPAEPGVGGLDVNRGRPDQPLVALTFDIEIDDTMLYQFLEIMGQRGVRGTFFVTGNWVQRYPDAARAIVAAGHEVGNHSLTHPIFPHISPEGAIQELQMTEDIVLQTTGMTTRPLFRFPYGEKNPAMINLLAGQGYISYHWTTDDNGMRWWLQSVTAGHINPNGAIILLHQRPGTVAALPGWLDQMLAAGLTPAPLSQVLR